MSTDTSTRRIGGKTFRSGRAYAHVYSLHIAIRRRGWYVQDIFVPHDLRGHGHGTALLRDICDEADYMNIPVGLHAIPETNSHFNWDMLKAWYGRYGFKPRTEDTMLIREPNCGDE
jgi:GNAT superfamily N-acetyltransferase